jgi:hypothetical protein
MKILKSISRTAMLVGSVIVAGVTDAASANVTQRIEPIYQVTSRQAGTIIIPGTAPGAQPRALTVNPGPGHTAAGGPPPIGTPPTGFGTAATTRDTPTPSASLNASSSNVNSGDGLRADHVIGGGTPSLTPYYYQPLYLSIPSALILAFSGAWFWARRRERSAVHSIAGSIKPSLDPEPMLRLMDDAVTAGDPELFFKSARAALQRNLALKWQLPPDAITLEEVDARLGAKSDVTRVFTLAVESAYAGVKLTAPEFQRWKRLVLGHINSKPVS